MPTRPLLLALTLTIPLLAAEKVHLTIDASQPGATIDRNIFGQFAEHLEHGIYEGIWVGPDSNIPNTRGIRNDVVSALKALKVPNVRWPGGCFADEYHWRKGIGPAGKRRTARRVRAGSGRQAGAVFRCRSKRRAVDFPYGADHATSRARPQALSDAHKPRSRRKRSSGADELMARMR